MRAARRQRGRLHCMCGTRCTCCCTPTFHFQDEAQDAVRGGMLRSKVDGKVINLLWRQRLCGCAARLLCERPASWAQVAIPHAERCQAAAGIAAGDAA